MKKIFPTKNYGLFRPDPCNREVGKLKKLIASMKENGFLPTFPISCIKDKSGKLIIKDGQHRFEAAQYLGIPVHYAIDNEHLNKANIPRINDTQQTWKLPHYLSSYCRQEYPDYLALRNYVTETGISIGQAVAILSGDTSTTNNHASEFKTGKFRIKDEEYGNAIADFVRFLKTNIKWGNDAKLVSALSRIFRVKEFKAKILKEKIVNYPGMIKKQPNIEAYTQLIDEIYNYHARTPIPLKFLAEQAMRKRTFYHHPTSKKK